MFRNRCGSFAFYATVVYSAEDHYARGIVIQALDLPNNLGVSGREFKTKPNPKGKGLFVYDPRTKFNGAKRNLICDRYRR
jgi:hypothetical protein